MRELVFAHWPCPSLSNLFLYHSASGPDRTDDEVLGAAMCLPNQRWSVLVGGMGQASDTQPHIRKPLAAQDCCKPSCSWNGKADFSRPVMTCAADGVTEQADVNLASGCGGGPAWPGCRSLGPGHQTKQRREC